MELYTIDPSNGFRRDILIDAYESLVWTERFIEPGDVNVVLPATREFVRLMRPGMVLGLSTSRELTIVNTRTIEEGKLTAVGKTLESFFDNRRNDKLTLFTWPGTILGEIVTNMQTRKSGAYAVPRVRVGSLDATPGTSAFEIINPGAVHQNLLTIAKKYTVGMALYWTERTDGNGYDLVFSTRTGQDLTGGDHPVIFSPDLDNLANVKELLSDVDAKNAAIAYPPQNLALAAGMAPVEVNLSGVESGFGYRVVEVNMDFLTKPEQLEGATTAQKQAALQQMMHDRARNALKPKKRIIDGEFAPNSQYRYYTEPNPDGLPEYRLGDKVAVQGEFMDPTTSILAEFIHSSDETGSRSYPGFVAETEFVSADLTPT